MRGHSTQKAEDRRWALRIGKAATGGFVRATKAGSRSLPPGAHAEAGTTSPRTPTLAAASSWNAHEGMASASRKRARAPRSLGARSSKPSPGNRAPARAACASWTAWCSTASCSTSATSRAARSPKARAAWSSISIAPSTSGATWRTGHPNHEFPKQALELFAGPRPEPRPLAARASVPHGSTALRCLRGALAHALHRRAPLAGRTGPRRRPLRSREVPQSRVVTHAHRNAKVS